MGLSSAAILLILVNLGFLAAGVFLIKFTIDLNSTGWVDALEETAYKTAAGTLMLAVKALGFATILLSLIGIVGAIIRSRMLLLSYSFIMVAFMIIFGVIGGTAFSFNSKMKNWQATPFPEGDGENDFAPKFNQIYCYAQGAFFCNSANTTDLVSIFLPTVPAEASALLPQVAGLNSLCAGNGVSMVPNMDTVCKACDMAKEFAKFDKILAWADTKCPRTASTSLWCAAFLQSGTQGAVYENSPYKQCRDPFLAVAVSWGNSLTMMGALAFVAAALLLALSCFARRSRQSSDNDDDDDMVIMGQQNHHPQQSYTERKPQQQAQQQQPQRQQQQQLQQESPAYKPQQQQQQQRYGGQPQHQHQHQPQHQYGDHHEQQYQQDQYGAHHANQPQQQYGEQRGSSQYQYQQQQQQQQPQQQQSNPAPQRPPQQQFTWRKQQQPEPPQQEQQQPQYPSRQQLQQQQHQQQQQRYPSEGVIF